MPVPDYPTHSRFSTLAKSAAVGAYAGTALFLLAIASVETQPLFTSAHEAWIIPVLIAGYGTFAIPFTALGLCLFGLPLRALLGPWRDAPWMALLAALCGAVAGLIFLWLFTGLTWGPLTLATFKSGAFGITWGVPTGLAYWHFERKASAPPRIAGQIEVNRKLQ